MADSTYPFVPKSTSRLLPGHFWALPLSNGTFGCGRVITLMPGENRKVNLRGFLAGLLDWNDSHLPNAQSIAGRSTLAQGHVHIKTVLETGGTILGHRPLELDSIEPDLFLSHAPSQNCMLQRGFEMLRLATKEEQAKLPIFSTWGYMVIRNLAEKNFVRK